MSDGPPRSRSLAPEPPGPRALGVAGRRVGAAPMLARLTLRPADRLKRRDEFRRVQDTGRKHHSPHFLVIVLARADAGPPRIGVTVTKRVGNAVERNRVKRLVREVFRRERHRFPAGCDVVFIAKDGAPGLSYDEVLAQVPSRWAVRREPPKERP